MSVGWNKTNIRYSENLLDEHTLTHTVSIKVEDVNENLALLATFIQLNDDSVMHLHLQSHIGIIES